MNREVCFLRATSLHKSRCINVLTKIYQVWGCRARTDRVRLTHLATNIALRFLFLKSINLW